MSATPRRLSRFERIALTVFIAVSSMIVPKTGRAVESVCSVIADNSIASHPNERYENRGNRDLMKIKGRENQPIIKFDLSAIPKTATITKAVLSVKLSQPDYRINQIGYSTVPTDWVEGKSHSASDKTPHPYSCFLWAGPSSKKWGDDDSVILDVIYGNGGNVTGWTLARQVGDRYEIDLPGRVIEAMRDDQPGGLILMDETGWWPDKLANIYILTRESKAGPILTVDWTDNADKTPPSPPSIRVVPADIDDGQMLVEITCGGDDGDRGVALGFDMKYLKGKKLGNANWSDGIDVPRYRIPRPKASGKMIKLWLKGFQPGQPYSIGIRARDEGGNISRVVSTDPTPATGPTPLPNLGVKKIPVLSGGTLKIGSRLQIWATDELCKIDPVTGETLGSGGYADSGARQGNTCWNGRGKRVILNAAKNEITAFRLALEKSGKTSVSGIRLTPLALKGSDGATIPSNNIILRREWYFKNKDGKWYGTGIPKLNDKNSGVIALPMPDNGISNQTVQTILVDVIVPKTIPAGSYSGGINVTLDDGTAGTVPIDLTVYDVTIPNTLSFIIELNSYGAGDKARFYATHRLAHYYRLGYNTLSYSHSGNKTLPFIPDVDGKGASAKISDWSAFDDWMTPLLTGTLFKDLPRGATPISHFYMPFYENYPMKIYDEYGDGSFFLDRHLKKGEAFDKNKWLLYVCSHDGYVADMFSDTWKKGAVKIAGDYRKHFEAKGWFKTQFQIYCNNKLYGRKRAGKTTTSIWTLDEPSFGRDFRALGFLYETFKKPFIGSKVDLITRGDISRPQWQGDRLDGKLDLANISSALYAYQPLLRRRLIEFGEKFWFYGGGRDATTDLTQITAVYIKAWTLGCDGGEAYWTSFHGNDWDENDQLACVLGAQHGYQSPANPTSRLTAQRRAQQDIELLNLLAKRDGWSRRRVARAVAAAVNLKAKTQTRGADDPGTTNFVGLSAADLAAIRLALLKTLSEKPATPVKTAQTSATTAPGTTAAKPAGGNPAGQSVETQLNLASRAATDKPADDSSVQKTPPSSALLYVVIGIVALIAGLVVVLAVMKKK